MKNVGTVAGSTHSSPSSIQSAEAGQRPAHRPGPHRRADRHPGQVRRSRSGRSRRAPCTPALVLPRAHDLRVERLAGGARRAAGRRAGGARRAWRSRGTRWGPCRARSRARARAARGAPRGRSGRRAAARRRPAATAATKTLRADFDQPLAAVHQHRSPGPRAEPVLGLHALPAQVAVAVADRLRLAGGAGGEDDQRRVVGREVARPRAGSCVESRSSGTASTGPSKPLARHEVEVALVRHHRRAARPRPCARAGRPAAAARCTAGPRRRCRQQASIAYDPLGPVADQRHHHVAGARPRARRARPPSARSGRPPRRSRSRAARRRARRATRASRDGSAASTTSRAKFIQAPTSARRG